MLNSAGRGLSPVKTFHFITCYQVVSSVPSSIFLRISCFLHVAYVLSSLWPMSARTRSTAN